MHFILSKIDMSLRSSDVTELNDDIENANVNIFVWLPFKEFEAVFFKWNVSGAAELNLKNN